MAFEEDKSAADREVEIGPRKGDGEMKKEELQKIMAALLADSKDYTDSVLSPDREKATRYYKGKPFGNEVEGRSKVVMTDVRDSTNGILPSFLKVLFGPEKPVEFKARTAEREAEAEQASDYIPYVFMEDNSGFLETLSVLKDGLIRRIGIFKWWYDEGTTKAYRMEGLTSEQAASIMQEPGVTITSVEKPSEDATEDLSVNLTRKEPGRIRVGAVAPEEFLYSREGRSIDSAQLVAHWTEKTTGELLAMGISQKDIDEHGGVYGDANTNIEKIARNEGAALSPEPETGKGKTSKKHLYVESYVNVDVDGDGEEELRKVCTLGPGFYVTKQHPTDERPFAIYVPDPEPHTIDGLSWADRTMDLQLLRSQMVRAINDSGSGSLFPRPEYVEGQVNVADLLNEDLGAPIRTKQPGMLNMHVTPFMGKDMLPVLQYFDGIKEERTGHNGAMAVDPDAMQSSTRAAVGAQVTASQEAREMLIRIFVEMCFKPMFKGLLRLAIKHQDQPRTIELRGKWVEMDPKSWNADMHVTVNVALGSTLVEDKVVVLQGVLEKMELIFSTLGPDSGLFTLVEYRNTLALLTELKGWKNSTRFWLPVTPESLAEKAQNAPPPKPTPEEMLVQGQLQIEQMKTEREFAIKEAELEIKRMDIMFRDDRERDKNAADIQLAIKKMELEYAVDLNEADISANIERERLTTQANVDMHAAETDAATQREVAASQGTE